MLHGGLIYMYCEMITTVGSANICLFIWIQMKEKKKKKILFVIMLRINSLNFSIYHTAVLAIAIMLFITSIVLILQLAFLSMIMKLTEFYIPI